MMLNIILIKNSSKYLQVRVGQGEIMQLWNNNPRNKIFNILIILLEDKPFKFGFTIFFNEKRKSLRLQNDKKSFC